MKNLLTTHKLITATSLLLILSFTAQASGSGEHEHEHKKMDHSKMDHSKMDHSKMNHGGGHRHSSWATPPAAYAKMKSQIWNDAGAAKRGEKLYATNCSSCHGAQGTGNGPVAKSLQHPPADLTNHFHKAPGEGDAYLFWRVSEGGQVEPFKSMNSAMPSFKASLSESQRWDVLAYVHQHFHKGFLNAKKQKMDSHDDKGDEHAHHH